jgi:hypothetical protein
MLDLLRFTGLAGELLGARRFSGDLRGLTGAAGVGLGWLAFDASTALDICAFSSSIALKDWVSLADKDFEAESVGFFPNISLMLLRLWNSGRSLPDNGGISFPGL